MPLIAVLDETAFTGLDESRRKDYVKNEKDNNYYLDITADEAGKLAINHQNEITRLKNHNSTVLGEKDRLQEKIKAFEQLGKTPQEIAEFYRTNGNVDVEALKKAHEVEIKGVRESVKTEVEAKQAAVEAANAERDTAFNQLREEMKEAVKSNVMREFGTTKLANDFLERRLAAVPESEGSNKFVVRVVNEKGEIEYKAGMPKTPAQLMEETKADKDYAGMFLAPNGGGTGGTNRHRATGNQDMQGLSPTEKLKVARQQS